MEEQTGTLFNMLSASAPTRVELPVHEGVLNIVKTIWQTLSFILPTLKRVEMKYFVPAKGFEYLYTHPPLGSLVVLAANERNKQGPTSSTPKNKEAKRLDLFGRKVYSTASLQFWVANHQVLLGRDNINLWGSLLKFKTPCPRKRPRNSPPW